MSRIWYHSWDKNLSISEKLISFIGNSGVSTCEYTKDSSPKYGVIFIQNISQQLLQFISTNSVNANTRLLVLFESKENVKKDHIWSLIKSGASDVITSDGSDSIYKKVLARIKRWIQIEELIYSPLVKKNLVGECKIWVGVLREIVEVAHFNNSSILITGESGTGKELVAHLIHSLDNRNQKQKLIIVDCTTIVPELSGSEFFGHERGAFTGAVSSRDGAFALANEGTLFLDEVGELPLNLQAQLLRVIQEHSFKRVGGNTWYNTNFRLICATNRDLLQEVNKGHFRADLYYRIAQWTCRLPSLLERKDDIVPLAKHFIQQSNQFECQPELDSIVQDYLYNREYPGNIRELKQFVSRILNNYVGYGPISVGDIPNEEQMQSKNNSLSKINENLEQNIKDALSSDLGLREIRTLVNDTTIKIALKEADGNIKKAASKLGVTNRALQLRRASNKKDNSDPFSDIN